MPNILFASNNIAHFPTTLAGSVVGTFDADRVPYSIALQNYEQINSPHFTPTTGDETWIHFRLYPMVVTQFQNDLMLVRGLDDQGRTLFKVEKLDGSTQFGVQATLYNGDSSATGDGSLFFTQNRLNFIDVAYTSTVGGLNLKVYVNGALGLEVNVATNPNSWGGLNHFSIGTAYATSLSSIQPVSEIIVADGDTRNARLDLLRPAAGGYITEWDGVLGVLSDDDTATGLTTLTGAKRTTVTLDAYSGAANISNVVTVSQTTRGVNSPTGMSHTVRLGGINYDTATIALDFPLQYNITDYQINPATSLPWVGSELSTIEIGFLSVT